MDTQKHTTYTPIDNPAATGEWTIHHPLLASLSHNHAGKLAESINAALAATAAEVQAAIKLKDSALETLFVSAKEFIHDWRKGDFSLCKLASCDAGDIEDKLVESSKALQVKYDTTALDAALAEATKPLVELLKTAIRCGRGLGSEWRDKAKIATQDWTDHNPLKLPASYREQSATLAKVKK